MSYRDEFDDPSLNRAGRGLGDGVKKVRGRTIALSVGITLAVFGGILWVAYPGSQRVGPDGEVPILRADADPFKVAPDEPGGMNVPHRDSTVFSSLRSQDEGRVENLLADEPSEDPIPKSQLFAGLNTEIAEDVTEPPSGDRVAPLPAEQFPPQPEARDNVDTPAIKAPEKVAAVQPAPKPVPKEAEKTSARAAAKIEPAAGSEAGSFYAQIASVTSESAAAAEWKKLQSSFSSLSGADHRVQRADLGAKGVYYRIQAGPLSRDKADSLCSEIKKARPGGCLVVAD